MPVVRRRAMEQGLHKSFGVPKRIKVFLDNGSFSFSRKGEEVPFEDYEEFVRYAKPDWHPIPRDFIPSPQMSLRQQRSCLNRTMEVNHRFEHDGFVPVIHISRVLKDYVSELKSNENLNRKSALALGGIVPNLLKTPKSLSNQKILELLQNIRSEFEDKKLHVFGVGGTSTLHVVTLLKMDSVDSSGWRNRAARGIIQLPGSGERVITQLGSWEGKELNSEEIKKLKNCMCPACQSEGIKGLKANGAGGFRNRATHNLWILLEEAKWIEKHLNAKTYIEAYQSHLNNSIYRPLIDYLANLQNHS